MDLKLATAGQEILLGPFLDDDDGITQKTGLTIANTDIKLFKAGGTTLGNKNSGGATEIATGFYYATLDATDTDTLGPLVVVVQITDCLCVRHEFNVVSAAYFDWVYGTTKPDVNTFSITNNAITANAINDGAITNAKVADDVDVNTKTITAGAIASTAFAAGAINADAIANGAIDAATFAADVSAKIATDVWNAATASYGGAGTYGQAVEDTLADTNELQTDDTPAALAAVKTVVDLIEDIIRNKMEITDANGNLVLYEDDGTTPKYSVNACVVDNSTTTTRKRLE
jgi:hypothetical protein